MKKILLALFVLAAAACSSFAQTTKSSDVAKFSIGVDPGLPVGNASNAYNFAIGGSLKYDMPIGSGTFFNLSAGYTAFLTKDALKQLGAKSSYGFVPLKAGLKYYFNGQGFTARHSWAQPYRLKAAAVLHLLMRPASVILQMADLTLAFVTRDGLIMVQSAR